MTADGDPILRAEHLTTHYETDSGVLDRLLGRSKTVRALDGVDLTLHRGETLGIVGESGCGKTTLARSLLRLVEPTEGAVYYRPAGDSVAAGSEKIDLTAASGAQLRSLRSDLQYVFQDSEASLNPRLTVGDLVGEPLDVHDIATGPARTTRIDELLSAVGLEPTFVDRYPYQLSGGQRQRVGIARALAVDPAVLVCDEPVSSLDVSVQAQILNLLADLQDRFDLSIVFVAHDLRTVAHVADRVAVMYLGEIVERGATDAVFEPPHHPYTEALLSAIPEPDPLWEGDRISLTGPVPSPVDPPSGCRFHTRCPRLIPPPETDLSVATWRSIYSFKQQVGAGDLGSIVPLASLPDRFDDPAAVEPTDLRPAELDALVREEFSLSDPVEDPVTERAFRIALDRVQEGDFGRALEHLEARLVSPCERRHPEPRDVGPGHEIACLHYSGEEGDG